MYNRLIFSAKNLHLMKEDNQNRYINYYLRYAFKELGRKQSDIISDLKKPQSYVSALMNGRKKVGREIAKLLSDMYGFEESKILVGDTLIEYDDDSYIKPINSTKEEVLKKLNLVRKNLNNNREISDDDVVEVIQYIVPIKGQAGLKKAFFAPDEYIELNFTKELIHVKPSERAIYHKIEVDGDSMPGILDQGDWARCEDIPKVFWTEKGTFKPNKVYCLFHRTKGILFKRISKVILETITLSSDNSDKDEYPDEVFDLGEFSKILIVRVVEKRL